MLQEYKSRSNQNMLDICLNTYGTFNKMGKILSDNGVYNPLYNTSNNSKFVFDNTIIKDVLVYNMGNIYATAAGVIIENTDMELTKRLTFKIGTDKPNGNTVQDDLLRQSTVLLVFVGGVLIEQDVTQGYVFNASTGTIDFSAIGGVYSTFLDILYNSAS